MKCQECGTSIQHRCPSCESVDANEALREAREEGRRAGIEEAYKIASEQSLLALRMKLEEALEAK